MRKIILIMALACIGWVVSCSSKRETVPNPSHQSQAELNELHGRWSIDYNDSIENEFQKLIVNLPQYEKELKTEKAMWEKYMEAVHEVASYEDYGSSTPMYAGDVVNQGIKLREESLHNLILHIQGGEATFCLTAFTPAMMANAYSAFINAIGEDEYLNQKSDYQASLLKEQKCWNDWIQCRKELSQKLTDELRIVYDECTNQMMRTKLLQLKNQNRALGMISGDIMKCMLPDDCSDKELLEYPGFDVVWAKHLKDLDWYPSFDVDSINIDDRFTVIYRKPVNGYKVKAVIKTDKQSLLSADITFEKDSNSFTLHSLSYGDTIFNKGWWGEMGDNDSILLKYRDKTVYADYHENNIDGETMAVWCPFFFRDLDFDGVEELIIVHYTCAVKYHNGYDVYRIVEGKPFLIDEPSYNNEVYDDYGMTDYPYFDFNNKTISCPYPEGELKHTGCIIYGISIKQKDTVVVNGRNHYFNHLEPIKKEIIRSRPPSISRNAFV